MRLSYADISIQVTLERHWSAILIEKASGIVFPTKVTATRAEGRKVVLTRAMELIETYLSGWAYLCEERNAMGPILAARVPDSGSRPPRRGGKNEASYT